MAVATIILVGVGETPVEEELGNLHDWLRDTAQVPAPMLASLGLAADAVGRNPWAVQVPMRVDAGKVENPRGGDSGCLTVLLVDAPVLQVPLANLTHHFHMSRKRTAGSDAATAAVCTRAVVLLSGEGRLPDRPRLGPGESSKVPLEMAVGMLDASQRAAVSAALDHVVDEKVASSVAVPSAARVGARWTALRGRFRAAVPDPVVGEEGPLRSTAVQLARLRRHRDPSLVGPKDACCRHLKFPEWVHTACDPAAGILLLAPRAPLTRGNLVPSLFHSMKYQLIYDALTGAIQDEAIMRGVVSPTASDSFWAAADYFTTDVPDLQSAVAAEQVGDITWKNCLVWICSTRTLRYQLQQQQKPPEPQDPWSAGSLHVLLSAPRSWSGRGRLRFAPRLDESRCGDCIMIVLCFAGPDRWAYATLQRASGNPSLPGPLRQLVGEAPTANRSAGLPAGPENTASGTVLHKLLGGGTLEAVLPEHMLKMLDKEQVDTIKGICSSPANLHFVMAYAGAGKTHVAKALMWLFARLFREQAAPTTGKRKVALWLVRTKVLRTEILHELLDGILAEEEVIYFGAGDPGSKWSDNDQARFHKRVLGLTKSEDIWEQQATFHQQATACTELFACGGGGGPSTANRSAGQPTHDAVTALAAAVSEEAVRAWTRLKTLAADCMKRLWRFHTVEWPEAVKAALSKILLVVCTTDVYLKIMAKDMPGAANMTFAFVEALLAFMDEAQRVRELALHAVAASVPNLICLGDPLQKLPSISGRAPSMTQSFLGGQPRQPEADRAWAGLLDLDLDQSISDRAAQNLHDSLRGARLWADEIIEARRESVPIWKLTGSKRCGEPLVSFLRELAKIHQEEGFELTTDRAQPTRIHFIFYAASSALWWNLWDVSHGQPAATQQRLGQDRHRWAAVVYCEPLFALLGMRIALQLAWLERRGTGGGEDDKADTDKPQIFVGLALKRLAGPLSAFLESFLGEPELRRHVGLQRLGAKHVAVRLPNDTTGPTYKFAYVIRHRRYKGEPFARVQGIDRDEDQHIGQQAAFNVLYCQLTRATFEACVLMSPEPMGWPEKNRINHPLGVAQRLTEHQGGANRRLLPALTRQAEILHAIARNSDKYTWSWANLDATTASATAPQGWQNFSWTSLGLPEDVWRPLQGAGWDTTLWQMSLWQASLFVQLNQGELVYKATTGALTGSQAGWSGTVQKLRGSSLLDQALHRLRDTSVQAGVLPPRPPLLRNPAFHARGTAQLCRDAKEREDCLKDLSSFATRIVPFVSVVVTGDCCYQLCVHLLQGEPVQCPHTMPLSYLLPNAEVDESEALEGSSLLRSFGLLIAAVFAKVVPQANLHRQSTAHKCTAMVDNDGGVWWTKQCRSDREAVNLFTLPGDVVDQPPKPDKPVRPLCYLYHGGGIDMQPEGVSGVVVRVRTLHMAAATVVAATLVAAMWDGGAPLGFGGDSIHNYEEMEAFSFELDARPSVDELLSAFKETCIKAGLGIPPVVDLTPRAARDLVLQLLQAAGAAAPQVAEPTPPVVVPLDGDLAPEEDGARPAGLPLEPVPGPGSPDYDPWADWSELEEDRPAATAPSATPPAPAPWAESTATAPQGRDREASPTSPAAPAPTSPAAPEVPARADAPAQPAAEPEPSPEHTPTEPGGPMPPEVLSATARVGVDLGGVLMQHMSREERSRIVPASGALQQLRRLIATFGVENVHIISYMGASMAARYRRELARPGGFLQQAGMPASNLHIIQDRDKFACLESLLIDYFIDDSIHVVEPLVRETDRRANLPTHGAGIYLGPRLCVLIPTVRADNHVDSIERYRHAPLHRGGGGRVVLATSLTDAATRVILHSASEARWQRR